MWGLSISSPKTRLRKHGTNDFIILIWIFRNEKKEEKIEIETAAGVGHETLRVFIGKLRLSKPRKQKIHQQIDEKKPAWGKSFIQ